MAVARRGKVARISLSRIATFFPLLTDWENSPSRIFRLSNGLLLIGQSKVFSKMDQQ